jgi:type IV secretion system protein VirB10
MDDLKHINHVQDAVPKIPIGTNISARVKVVGIAVVLLLAAIIVIFIHAYSPHEAAKPLIAGNPQLADAALNAESSQQAVLTTIKNIPDGLSTAANAVASQVGFGGAAAVAGPSAVSTVQVQGLSKQDMSAAAKSGLTPSGFDDLSSNQQSAIPSVNNVPANGVGGNANNAALSSLNALTPPSPTGQQSYGQQNMQSEKQQFMAEQQATNPDVLPIGVQNPASQYLLQAGSIIPAILETGIDSDLPGVIKARVTENVFDTISGNYILIPQGSVLYGAYDSQIAYGQSRVLMVWNRVMFPNGQYIDLDGMPGADLAGLAGLTDQVDNHYIRIFGSAILMSMFSAGMQLSQPQSNSQNGQLSNQQIIAGALGQNVGQLATQMTQQNLNIQPTINIRPGDLFNVIVTRDIPFSGPYQGN